MPPLPTKPPQVGPGGEGPSKGAEFTSANGWNFFTRTLHSKSPQSLHHARHAAKAVHDLIRTGR